MQRFPPCRKRFRLVLRWRCGWKPIRSGNTRRNQANCAGAISGNVTPELAEPAADPGNAAPTV